MRQLHMFPVAFLFIFFRCLSLDIGPESYDIMFEIRNLSNFRVECLSSKNIQRSEFSF